MIKYIQLSCVILCLISCTLQTKKPMNVKNSLSKQFYGPKALHDQSITIYCHGLGGNKNEAQYFHVQSGLPNAFIQGPLKSFNFKDVHDPSTSCLGQEADIAYLSEACKPYTKVQLFGISRGASTIASYVGLHKPLNVKSLVLESPFDSVQTIVQRLTGLPQGDTSSFPNYNPQGIQPIQVVDSIPHNIPILIVASKKDTLIPVSCSAQLYKKLRQNGHNNAYLLVVDHGNHANILNGKDGQVVKHVIHAFYKAHNQPHNSEWARLGESRFAQCQPIYK